MRIVSRYYLSESNAGAGLAANETSNAGLVLHNAVRDAHFTAERRQKDDELKTKKVTIITWSSKFGYRNKLIQQLKQLTWGKQTYANNTKQQLYNAIIIHSELYARSPDVKATQSSYYPHACHQRRTLNHEGCINRRATRYATLFHGNVHIV